MKVETLIRWDLFRIHITVTFIDFVLLLLSDFSRICQYETSDFNMVASYLRHTVQLRLQCNQLAFAIEDLSTVGATVSDNRRPSALLHIFFV